MGGSAVVVELSRKSGVGGEGSRICPPPSGVRVKPHTPAFQAVAGQLVLIASLDSERGNFFYTGAYHLRAG